MKNTIVLIFRHIQCLPLIYIEILSLSMLSMLSWILLSSGNQIQLQITLSPEYRLDYLFVSSDYGYGKPTRIKNVYEDRKKPKILKMKKNNRRQNS